MGFRLAFSYRIGSNRKVLGMSEPSYRQAIADYIRAHAEPADKFSHQPRLYHQLAENQPFDDDVLHAAAWMHDVGVFIWPPAGR
jgi:hypothetical protein